MKLKLNRRKLLREITEGRSTSQPNSSRFPVRVMDWRKYDRDKKILHGVSSRNIKILLDGRVQQMLFYADLNRGIVGTYDTRGDGAAHASNDEVETAFLTGKVEIEDRQGRRWV